MPILDGLRRLTEFEPEPEDRPETDTFHDRSRKTSKTEEKSDLSSLRNLSTNGLMMFDPLVINAMTASASDANRQFPDHDLVTSLNEQVTEINDRLSSIAGNDVDIIDPMHSFSTSDVPSLISTEDSNEFGFAGARNELTCMPSTSHGYLIPNAISHEPAVLSSLSHNNSTVFNPEDDSETMTNSAMIMPDHPIDNDITTNITLSIANANLSSLLLTNEEYMESFETNDDASFHSAKMTMENQDDDKVKFMLGYESDHESPADSGVSTENTSLDRSPDNEKEGFVDNTVQRKTENSQPVTESADRIDIADRIEQNTRRFEASSSVLSFSSDDDCELGLRAAEANRALKEEARKVLNDWGMPMPENEDCKSIDDVIAELRKQRREKKMAADAVETTPNTQSSSQTQSSSRKKDARRKSTSKNKRKKGKMFMVILETGVADQLQTNFAADLRNILKSVFLMNQTPDEPDEPIEEKDKPPTIEYEVTEDQVIQNETGSQLTRRNTVNSTTLNEQPESAEVRTEMRRKSGGATRFNASRTGPGMGKVFCASCSSNSCPLPRYGQLKPVRVCEECFRSIATNCHRQTT
ncbi:Uncharacterized protein OBRU01_18412, partial [Operophtera brumata]